MKRHWLSSISVEKSLLHKCMCSVCQRESLSILDMSWHVQRKMTHGESLNQPHIVKCIKVRGQSEEWLIKSHSEHMAVLKPKAYITVHKTPHGFSHTAAFYCFSLFLYLPLLLLHFLLPVSDVRLSSGLEDIPLSLQRYFTVTWYKCLL